MCSVSQTHTIVGVSNKLLVEPLWIEVLELLASRKWPGTVQAPAVAVYQSVLGIVPEKLKSIRVCAIVDAVEVVRTVVTKEIGNRPVKIPHIESAEHIVDKIVDIQ